MTLASMFPLAWRTGLRRSPSPRPPRWRARIVASGATIVGADTYASGAFTVSTDNGALIAISAPQVSNPSQTTTLTCSNDGAAEVILTANDGTVLQTVPVTCAPLFPNYSGSSSGAYWYGSCQQYACYYYYVYVSPLSVTFDPTFQTITTASLTLYQYHYYCPYNASSCTYYSDGPTSFPFAGGTVSANNYTITFSTNPNDHIYEATVTGAFDANSSSPVVSVFDPSGRYVNPPKLYPYLGRTNPANTSAKQQKR